MSNIPITRAEEDALYERIRLMMFSADLPVQRLDSDIEDIGRFTQPDARSPHVRLVEAMPPLAPAAEAIVRAMIRAYGMELFGRGRAQTGLCAMIKTGPVTFGQTALMLGPDAPVPSRARALVEEFNHIFERHPHSGFAQARRVLAAIGLPFGPDASSEVRRA
ncbi:MAG: hypothetical protein V4797_00735 [Paraburkholderia tropica]|uniref:hypothetical protein n=1 Tax=Paraburkholderia tropica TaxID=92647 RepID=UPI003100F798